MGRLQLDGPLQISAWQLAAVVVAIIALTGLTVAAVTLSYEDEIRASYGSVEQQPSDLTITDVSHNGPGSSVDQVHVDIKNTNEKPVAANVGTALMDGDDAVVADAEETELMWQPGEEATVPLDVPATPGSEVVMTDVGVTEIPMDKSESDKMTPVSDLAKQEETAPVAIGQTPDEIAVTDVTHDGSGEFVDEVQVDVENTAEEPVPIDVATTLANGKDVVTEAEETGLVVPPGESGTVPVGVEPMPEDEFDQTEVDVSQPPTGAVDVDEAEIVTEQPNGDTLPGMTVQQTPTDVKVTDTRHDGSDGFVDEAQVEVMNTAEEPVPVGVQATLVDDKATVAKAQEAEVLPPEETVLVPVDVEQTPEDEFTETEIVVTDVPDDEDGDTETTP
ncbi:hypothetical protein [Natronorubrum sp. A-ect3]|uniref:hypothetical protein n=1 Tax=Natronorubrum sp. A-ect3 TaxID=3242698 RepID=UPI00359D295D